MNQFQRWILTRRQKSCIDLRGLLSITKYFMYRLRRTWIASKSFLYQYSPRIIDVRQLVLQKKCMILSRIPANGAVKNRRRTFSTMRIFCGEWLEGGQKHRLFHRGNWWTSINTRMCTLKTIGHTMKRIQESQSIWPSSIRSVPMSPWTTEHLMKSIFSCPSQKNEATESRRSNGMGPRRPLGHLKDSRMNRLRPEPKNSGRASAKSPSAPVHLTDQF